MPNTTAPGTNACHGSPSPDGSALAFVSSRDDHSFVSVYRFATKTLTYLAPGTYSDSDPVWSPDGKYFVYSGADVGTTFPLRALGPDGRPYGMASLVLTRGARRVASLMTSPSRRVAGASLSPIARFDASLSSAISPPHLKV